MTELFITIYEDWIRPAVYWFSLFYGVPYLVRRGWGDAENRTKKVCDVCFRDIKKWNERVNKAASQGDKD